MPPFARKEIKNSFVKLLTQRPISQITVKDIVEDCGVNRNSFYYHFQDIPSLLEEIIVEMTEKVIDSLPEESTFEEKVTAALVEITRNKKAVAHIYGSNNREFYEKQLMKICEHVTRSYIHSRDYSEGVDRENLEYVISYLKCELFGQLIDWLNHDMSYDIVEHSKVLCRLFAGSMRNVCQKYKII
ncbi:MAG: TetR/AcrR family transcriptional regulator C-terminal domain-containing protein [Lachnospiraceae bacterium]|nr:TetR/AcrR family transcriptional regulator C-terminal domain-containing protein [Lachnospiraceae bacterium]